MDSVVHFELPAHDKERAKNFYQQTFDWQIEEYPQMDYTILRTGEVDEDRMLKQPGVINGGMALSNKNLAAPSFAISVEDMDKSMAMVKEHGGKILTDKMEVGEMGWMAYFKDTEGNVLSLWQNKIKM